MAEFDKGKYDTGLFEKINSNLESINKKLNFFYWLAIISIVLSLIVWISGYIKMGTI